MVSRGHNESVKVNDALTWVPSKHQTIGNSRVYLIETDVVFSTNLFAKTVEVVSRVLLNPFDGVHLLE